MTITTVTGFVTHVTVIITTSYDIEGCRRFWNRWYHIVCVKKPITLLKFELQTLSKLTVFPFPYLQVSNTTTNCCSNHLPEWHLWYADFSKVLNRLSSSRDYKRTWQEALAALLPYLYKLQVVHATTICLSHVYSTVTM